MGFQSQSGYLMLKKQATPGTFDPAMGTTGVAFYARSGNLAPNRDLMIPDPEIGGIRDVVDAYLGPVSFTGDISLYTRLRNLPYLIGGVFGSVGAPSITTGISTFTQTPIDSGALPWFSCEQNLAGTLETFNYTDVKMNTLHFECDAAGYTMTTLGLIARLAVAGATASNPVASKYDASPLIVGTNITVTYNGATLPAKSFSLDVNNNLEDSDFRLGSFFLGDTTEKRRDVTMGVTIRPADSSLWRQAVFGLPAATSPGGLSTKQQVVITLTSYEDIPGGTPATKYTTTITVPKATIVPFAIEPSGDDVIEHSLEIRALRPATATPIMTVVTKTDLTAIV